MTTNCYQPLREFQTNGSHSSQVIYSTEDREIIGKADVATVNGASLEMRFTPILTLDQLKAFTHAQSAALAQVLVLGAVTPGDGLGRHYRWMPDSVVADDTLTVIELDLGGTGRWHEVPLSFSKARTSLGNYPDDASAAAGGVAIGEFYRNGTAVQIRVI